MGHPSIFLLHLLNHLTIYNQVLERKDISGMTEVPGVGNMTRVLFRYPTYPMTSMEMVAIFNSHDWVSMLNTMCRDLKKMTDVSNVETLTEVSKAEVDFSW